MNVDNSCAPTAADTVSPAAKPPDEVTRVRHLNHEAALRFAGVLYLISGIFLLVAFLSSSGEWPVPKDRPDLKAYFKPVSATLLLGALVSVHVWIAYGLRDLNPKVRRPAVIFSFLSALILCLVIKPVAMIINLWVIHLVTSRKGRFVLSEEYKQLVAATPHLKPDISPYAWILIAILEALLLWAFMP